MEKKKYYMSQSSEYDTKQHSTNTFLHAAAAQGSNGKIQ